MKYIQVDGVSLSSSDKPQTYWALNASPLKKSMKDTPLCILECASEKEAQDTIKDMNNSFTEDGKNESTGQFFADNPTYYLMRSRRYVIASLPLLEAYFDGRLIDVPEQKKISYYVTSNHHVFKFKFLDSEKRSMKDDDLSLDDYSEDFLGAKKWSRHSKSNPVTKGWYYTELLYPDKDNYQILWLDAPSYNGNPMLSAYGCTAGEATILKKHIEQAAAKKNIHAETFILQRKEDILVASKEGLDQIFGPALSIQQQKPGLRDKSAAHRSQKIQTIYHDLDRQKMTPPEKVQSSTSKTHPYKKIKLQPHSIFNSRPQNLPALPTPSLQVNPSFMMFSVSKMPAITSPSHEATAPFPVSEPFNFKPFISQTAEMSTEDWIDSVIIYNDSNLDSDSNLPSSSKNKM